MDYQEITFEIKELDEKTGEFHGLASVYDVVDLQDDIVERGAFKRTLDHGKGKLPLLWQHDPSEPIGVIEVTDSRKGLKAHGFLNLEVARAREALALIRQKAVSGLSIGYKVIKHLFDGPVRRLKELALGEISVVTFPANVQATISSVKTVPPFQDLPLASRDRPWRASAAIQRVRAFTDSEDEPSRTYWRGFAWWDIPNRDQFGAYKFPISDVIDGKLTAVPRAIFAAAAVVQGARGGADIPDADLPRLRTHLGKYYDKMDLTPPWEQSSLSSTLSTVSSMVDQIKEDGETLEEEDVEVLEKAMETLQAVLNDNGLSDPGLSPSDSADEIEALAEMADAMDTHFGQ